MSVKNKNTESFTKGQSMKIFLGILLVMLEIGCIDYFKLNSAYLFGVVLTAFGTLFLFAIYVGRIERAIKRNKRESKEEAMESIVKKFNDDEEISFRAPRGFALVEFVISKMNGWSYNNKYFISKEHHFSLGEVLNFQKQYN